MKITDILSFINPFGDVLSTVFVLLLVSLSILTIIWLQASAKVENWENNWHGEHLEDSASLDSEHGSVHELAEAVATKAEQVAEIMPSMLLVLGLLGTFLGLGIALNSASDVLATANTSGMDSAMANLMSLMEGLGAKFKTSTWGLLCFIALNILFNVLGFKEKRLAWAIGKVKQEAKIKNALKNKLEQERYDAQQERYKTQQDLLKQSLKIQVDGFKANLGIIQALGQQLQQQHTTLMDGLKTQNNQVISTLNNNQNLIQSLNEQNQEAINILAQGFQKHIEQIRHDGKQHIGELQNIVNSNKAIQQASEMTAQELKAVAISLTKGFEENTKQLQNGSSKSLAELKKIADYNQQTQQAMQDFVDKTVSSMKTIGDSAGKMGESAKAVGKSAMDLNNVVQKLKSELTEVMSMVKSDLGETITDMNDSFKANITEMSESIQENMTEMSNSMSHATRGIETAVGSLSVNVGNTMNEVTQTIGKSMDLQEESAREFTVTSKSLNIHIMEMTGLVQQLSGNITNSLKSVAENGRRMESIGKKLESFSAFFKELSNTNPQIIEHLDKVADSNQNINQTLAKLSEQNNKDNFNQLISVVHDVQKELNTLGEFISQNYQTNQYKRLLEKISDDINKLANHLNSIKQES